ncbi:hypothetical protein J2T13_002536 [Paenibacillus sp. DS2015]
MNWQAKVINLGVPIFLSILSTLIYLYFRDYGYVD